MIRLLCQKQCRHSPDGPSAWSDPSPELEPTLHAAKDLALKYAADPNVDLDFFMDCHAHTCSKHAFLYVNPPEDRGRGGVDNMHSTGGC